MDYANFKLKDLRLINRTQKHLSPEIKYRQVFDRSEIEELTVEISLYNKKFDEKDWNAELEVVIWNNNDLGNVEVIDTEQIDIEASSDKNILNLSYTIEQYEGQDWTGNNYLAEIWIDKKKISTASFSLVDNGKPENDENPYFDVFNVKFFEGGPEPEPKRYERAYIRQFQRMATRFIWTELEIKNKLPETAWKGEFIFNYYNDLGQVVHHIERIVEVTSNPPNQEFIIDAGCGDPVNVSWEEGNYMVEVVFMGNRIVIAPFKVGSEIEKGNGDFKVVFGQDKNEIPAIISGLSSEAEIFREMDALVGLKSIKKRLHDYAGYIKYMQLRDKMGIESMTAINLHAVFSGNPGTGKTTIAKMLGKIYKSLGLLSKDTVYEAGRANLVGRYIGETAPTTKDIIEKARGGILLIDEAYSLAVKSDDNKDYGREVIETLLTEMSDGPGDIAIIVCGYPKEMEAFLDFNPGLRSRFRYHYDFPDYTPEELIEIARREAKHKQLEFSEEVSDRMFKYLEDQYRCRTRSFGNARIVKSMLEEAQLNLGIRVINSGDKSLTREDLCIIQPCDIEELFNKNHRKTVQMKTDEQLLAQALHDLKDMTGLDGVKTEISELTKLARFYAETGKDIVSAFSLNNIFTGNPGTGKTTVARIVAQIYKALGILERGHLVECSREDLIGTVVGETAPKTLGKIEAAIGGVLFIDEAYSLTNGNNNDFGREAIEVIIKQMEDRRGEFSLIVAGYPKEMGIFLDSNPGLRSRFDNHLIFNDFNEAELIEIARIQLKKAGLLAEPEAIEHLEAYFMYHANNRNQYFGNGRFVRKVIEKAIRNQNLRLSQVPKTERSEAMMKTITLSDVHEFSTNSDTLVHKQIGFMK
ncbi:MAG: AAA family ATPase [Lentimicrobium sp.]|jgi:SpoVK/Ycf46/Vps4 family AAA+-type ATPase|nr:AAA family ATPase [Lentimicrobium sp.]